MKRARRSLQQRDQDGFTMVELLVATAMMVIITAATVSLFISTVKDQSRVTSRADQVGEARAAMRKMVDDIRQASEITATPTVEELKIKTYVHAATCSGSPSASATAILCTVTYKCVIETSKTTAECTRATEAGTVTIIKRISSKAIFTYSPSIATTATYVTVKLELPASSGTYKTTLENGAALRNTATNLTY